MTPEEIINGARDYHSSFDERQTPTASARRFVNRYDEELYQEILRMEPEYFLTSHEISFPLNDFDAGYTALPDYYQHRGGTVYIGDQPIRDDLHIVPFSNRHMPGTSNAAYLLGDNTIHFVGEEADWEKVNRVVFYYVPARTVLTDVTTESTLPDFMKPAMVERLALFMAGRGSGASEEDISLSLTREDWKETEIRCLQTAGDRGRADAGYVREEW